MPVLQLVRIGGRTTAFKIAGRGAGDERRSPSFRAISVESSIGPPRIAQSILPPIRSGGFIGDQQVDADIRVAARL